jgi:cytochrome c556
MDLMKGQAKQMKLIGDMAKGKKAFDAAKAAPSLESGPQDGHIEG